MLGFGKCLLVLTTVNVNKFTIIRGLSVKCHDLFANYLSKIYQVFKVRICVIQFLTKISALGDSQTVITQQMLKLMLNFNDLCCFSAK